MNASVKFDLLGLRGSRLKSLLVPACRLQLYDVLLDANGARVGAIHKIALALPRSLTITVADGRAYDLDLDNHYVRVLRGVRGTE